jgi:hypothetical protein
LAGCLSPPNSFNVFIYRPYEKPYTSPAIGDTMTICSGDDLTQALKQGWQLWNGPYRDVAGCDSKTTRVTQDPNYLNVMIIKKIT